MNPKVGVPLVIALLIVSSWAFINGEQIDDWVRDNQLSSDESAETLLEIQEEERWSLPLSFFFFCFFFFFLSLIFSRLSLILFRSTVVIMPLFPLLRLPGCFVPTEANPPDSGSAPVRCRRGRASDTTHHTHSTIQLKRLLPLLALSLSFLSSPSCFASPSFTCMYGPRCTAHL